MGTRQFVMDATAARYSSRWLNGSAAMQLWTYGSSCEHSKWWAGVGARVISGRTSQIWRTRCGSVGRRVSPSKSVKSQIG